MQLASWLKSFHVHGRTPAETVPLVNRQEKTVVETIVAHRERTSDKGRYLIEHLVKWNGYGPEHQIASLKCSYAILQIALRPLDVRAHCAHQCRALRNAYLSQAMIRVLA